MASSKLSIIKVKLQGDTSWDSIIGSPISVTLYSSGSLVISKDRDDIDDEALESINAIVGGEL